MADLFGQAFWPGANSSLECSYVNSWGITPGRAELVIPPQVSTVAEIGDLVLTDGANAPIRLPGCRVAEYTGSNVAVRLLIEDRRWRWRLGQISGRYNVPAERTSTVTPVAPVGQPAANPLAPPQQPPAGEEPVQPHTQKNAQELAKLCLAAMGETSYDVSALDPKALPTVEWDVTNPAGALQGLVESLGCVIVYRPDTDSVLIAKRGEGQNLPGGALMAETPSVEVKDRPSKIVLHGAPTRYQVRFALEAVGMDFDGSIKPIDKLSYRPSSGVWTSCSPPLFASLLSLANLPGSRTAQDAVGLAAQWVYRAYRIRITGAGIVGKFYVPPRSEKRGDRHKNIEIKRIQQVRLLPVKNVVAKDDLSREATAPAACYGRHNPPLQFKPGQPAASAYADTTAATEVKCPFTVDEAHQLIIFSRYVYGIHSDNLIYPAEIALECAAEIQDPDTNQYVRYTRELKLSGGAGGEAVLVRDDVRSLVTAEYDSNNNPKNTTDNNRETERRADYFLRGELVRYTPDVAVDRQYPGLLPIFPDGQIQQVTHTLGGGSAQNPNTRASANTEHALYLPSYRARRRVEETNLDQQRANREELIRVKRRFEGPADPFTRRGF